MLLAQVQIEGDFLACSFSILEEQPMDMLLGLDMLKRHQVIKIVSFFNSIFTLPFAVAFCMSYGWVVGLHHFTEVHVR